MAIPTQAVRVSSKWAAAAMAGGAMVVLTVAAVGMDPRPNWFGLVILTALGAVVGGVGYRAGERDTVADWRTRRLLDLSDRFVRDRAEASKSQLQQSARLADLLALATQRLGTGVPAMSEVLSGDSSAHWWVWNIAEGHWLQVAEVRGGKPEPAPSEARVGRFDAETVLELLTRFGTANFALFDMRRVSWKAANERAGTLTSLRHHPGPVDPRSN